MYLDQILNSKIKIIEKIDHFDLAVREGMEIPESTMKRAIKLHPNFFKIKYCTRNNSRVNSSKRKGFSLLITIVFSRGYNRIVSKKTYKNNVSRLLPLMNINWNSNKHKSVIEEVIYSGDYDNTIFVLNKIKDLNVFFAESYLHPTQRLTSLKYFKYLMNRGFNFESVLPDGVDWYNNFFKAKGLLNSRIVNHFLNKCLSSSLSISSYIKDYQFCFNYIYEKIVKDNSLVSNVSLMILDQLILEYKIFSDKQYKDKLLDIRSILFKVNKEDKKSIFRYLNEDLLYISYLSEEELDVIRSKNGVDDFIDSKSIVKYIESKMFYTEGSFKIYNCNNIISKIIRLKKMFPEIAESELIKIPDSIKVYLSDQQYKSESDNLILYLLDHYDDKKVVELLSSYKESQSVNIDRMLSSGSQSELPPKDIDSLDDLLKDFIEVSRFIDVFYGKKRYASNRGVKDFDGKVFQLLSSENVKYLFGLGLNSEFYKTLKGDNHDQDLVIVFSNNTPIGAISFNIVEISKEYYIDGESLNISLEELRSIE
jgi:hypothetical protein